METETSGITGRVLVVDDEEGMRRVCARALRAVGHSVDVAEDAESAVKQLPNGFDVVLTDIWMPGMDGMELLRHVREQDSDIPVIMMTAVPNLGTAVGAIEHGISRYLTKPFATSELVSVVEQAVKARRLSNARREALELVGPQSPRLERARLEAAFSNALASLWMAYQPIVAPGERRIEGHEALLRSAESALPHPGAVIDAAERLGRLHELGRVVRERVAETVAGDAGSGSFFVNLHAYDLSDDSLMSPDSPLSRVASRVVLEITERAALDGLHDLRARITALRDLGFRLAVDDMGAGYAGLTTFASIEPDIVKIDMSLVRDVDKSPIKQKIIRGLTELAHELKILVVAEGIETPGEGVAIGAMGCDLMQGYLFAKPGRPFPSVNWQE